VHWEVIGDALGLLFLASAYKIGVGDQALDYALTYNTSPGPRQYTWTCPPAKSGAPVTSCGPAASSSTVMFAQLA
jgi:hypothetical protein